MRRQKPYRPLYYDLADEPGIADLAAAWDFDLSPESLEGMRGWLRTQYADLAGLNREWGTAYAAWPQVMPMTTDQALARRDGNFAAWADFKAWMDEAFARAVRRGTDAVHAADPAARAAIEGAQAPGWGGYDYTRLAGAVDAMEISDHGESPDIARDMNPSLTLLTTLYGQGADDRHALWHAVLAGVRGVILWDEANGLVATNGMLAPDGRRLAPLLRELHGGAADMFAPDRRVPSPVGILYSPASMRVQWLLDRQRDPAPWASRDAAAEFQDTAGRAAMHGFANLAGHLGVAPRWLSAAMLTQGGLRAAGIKLLILPHTIALADADAQAIRRFTAAGGALIADMLPGAFDEHGRRRAAPALADVFAAHAGTMFSPTPGRDAADGVDAHDLDEFAQLLDRAGAAAPFRLATSDGKRATRVTAYRFRDGADEILALEHDGLGAEAVRVTWAGGASTRVRVDFERPEGLRPGVQRPPGPLLP